MALTFQWLGHSGFLLDVDGRRAAIDPFLTNNQLAPISADQVEVEVVLLTHAHGDHVGFTDDSPAGDTISIVRRSDAMLVCNFEMGNWFSAKGIEKISQGNPGGTYRGEFLDAKWTQAFHSSSFPDGSYGGQPNGYIIRAGGFTLYHAGDTNLFGDMALIGEEGLDVAFLPIGDTFTMGPEDSIRAIKLLHPRYVVPIHYNTFPPIAQDAGKWAEMVNRETDAQPIVLDPGDSHKLE